MTGPNEVVLSETQELELRLAKAMAHPARIEALELLRREPMAPVEVADRLNVPLSNMSYHFRTLLELECIEEVGKEPVRGSVKTTYRSCVDLLILQARWGGANDKALDELTGSILRNTADRIVEAIEAKTFELREEVHLTVQTVNMTETEWREMTAALEGVRERLAKIAAASRRSDASEPRFPATFSVQAYESPQLYER